MLKLQCDINYDDACSVLVISGRLTDCALKLKMGNFHERELKSVLSLFGGIAHSTPAEWITHGLRAQAYSLLISKNGENRGKPKSEAKN